MVERCELRVKDERRQGTININNNNNNDNHDDDDGAATRRKKPRVVFSANVTIAGGGQSDAMLPSRTKSLPASAARMASDPSTGFLSHQPQRSAVPLISNNGQPRNTGACSTSSSQRGRSGHSQDRSTGGPVPPDGGWGWMVALASFTINFIVDGVCLSYGVFYVELRENFGHDSISKIAFIGSLTTGTCLFMGPFAGGLANKYGCRPLTIAGSIISSLFIGLSALSPNVDVLLVTYGIMGGVGFGMMYLPSIVIVSFYFGKRRALATGIAVCGSGMGVLVFSPVARFLLDAYGWRGGNLILAGFVLNGIACGMVFRPLSDVTLSSPSKKTSALSRPRMPPSRSTSTSAASTTSSTEGEPPLRGCIFEKIIQEKIRQREGSTGSLDGTVITLDNRIVRVSAEARCSTTSDAANEVWAARLSPDTLQTKTVTEFRATSVDGATIASATTTVRRNADEPRTRTDDRCLESGGAGVVVDGEPFHSGDDDDFFTFTTDYDDSVTCADSDRTKNLRTTSVDSENNSVLPVDRARSGNQPPVQQVDIENDGHVRDSHRSNQHDQLQPRQPFGRADIFYSGSVSNLNVSDFDAEQTHEADRYAVVDWTETSRDRHDGCMQLSTNCLPKCNEIIDGSLLHSCTFIILCVAIVIPFFGIYTPFVYIADHADQLGVSKDDAVLLLSVLGISNTIGRVVAGWLADRPTVDSVSFHNICLLIAGLATCVVPVLTSYQLICVYLVVYGLCIAVFITLKSIIIVELLGLRKLTSAFGLTAMFQGIAALAGTPMTGMLYDVTDSYSLSFIVAGSLLVVGGLVSLPIRRVKRWELERSKRKDYASRRDHGANFCQNKFKN